MKLIKSNNLAALVKSADLVLTNFNFGELEEHNNQKHNSRDTFDDRNDEEDKGCNFCDKTFNCEDLIVKHI